MQNLTVFATQNSSAPEITPFRLYLMWYPQNDPNWITPNVPPYTEEVTQWLQGQPPGKRALFLRWFLQYQSYMESGADPLAFFETGTMKISSQIRYLRPLGQQLRRQGVAIDGIWTECEGGFNSWNLTPTQMQAIYASPRARARMPPGVRALTPDMFLPSYPGGWTHAKVLFDRWANLLLRRVMRQILVTSGIFRIPRTPGGPPVQPPTSSFLVSAPTFPVYDQNGWPYFSCALDGRTSSPGCTFGTAGRYASRTHDPLWNALADHVNMIRSCMRRPGACVWPVIAWPTKTSPWLYEQMIAHFARTGLNNSTNSAYIYWLDSGADGTTEDPLAAQIFSRHDQAFPALRNLPEIPMDADSITTAGFTTTYTDFLDNVPPSP